LLIRGDSQLVAKQV
jgi:ribonuclease HI